MTRFKAVRAVEAGLVLLFGLVAGCETQRFPEIDNREKCFANLRAIHRAIQAYSVDHSGKLPSDVVNANGDPLLSWRVQILPYLGETELFEQFRLDEPWNSSANRRLVAAVPQVLLCPNVVAEGGMTSYRSCWKFEEPGSLGGNGIQCLEAGQDYVEWTRPEAFSLNDFEQLGDPKLSVHGRRYFGINSEGEIVVVDYHKMDNPIFHIQR